MLVVRCPACEARYKVPESVAGRPARCKRCGQRFVLGAPRPDSGRLSLTKLDDSLLDEATADAGAAEPQVLASGGRRGRLLIVAALLVLAVGVLLAALL